MERAFQHSFTYNGSRDRHFSYPLNVVVGRYGTIYVADRSKCCIQCFHSNGTFIPKWGRMWSGDGEFSGPRGLAISIDSGTKESVLFAMSAIPEWNAFPPGLLPICVSYMDDEYNVHEVTPIYVKQELAKKRDKLSGGLESKRKMGTKLSVDVPTAKNPSVEISDGAPAASYLQAWDARDGRFSLPYGVAVAEDRTVYVSDCANHCILCFRPDGALVNKWGCRGDEDGQLNAPSGLAVTEYDNCRRSILDAVHRVDAVMNFPPGILPICAAYAGDYCLLVADSCNHRMQVFSMDGKFLRRWGRRGTDDGQFLYPRSCCTSKRTGFVYVADQNDQRVQAFDANGVFFARWCIPGQSLHADLLSSALTLYTPSQVTESEWLYVVNSEKFYRVHITMGDNQRGDKAQTPNLYKTLPADSEWRPSFMRLPSDGIGPSRCGTPTTSDRKGGHFPPGKPTVILIDNNEIYVGVAGTRNLEVGYILRCRLNGDIICKYDLFTYSWPVGMAKGPDKVLYVCDANRPRICVVNL